GVGGGAGSGRRAVVRGSWERSGEAPYDARWRQAGVTTDVHARPFWEQAPKVRFSDRARDYAGARPDYPRDAVAAILDGLGPAAALVAADVGAGTGIASRRLALAGLTVCALQPKAARAAARA